MRELPLENKCQQSWLITNARVTRVYGDHGVSPCDQITVWLRPKIR